MPRDDENYQIKDSVYHIYNELYIKATCLKSIGYEFDRNY